ncbi:zinc finger protein 85-like [Anopheles maculipalpis]|uniref:zinc finger protein 85-like n=1 Tax=Anopheles maculipalpis TaxID=1496333 RepID=UPI0021590B25|nr:zinc finger protein 85-like [Anopheles maculipalpis]
MANLLEELLNVCRFCLSENKQYLQPIMKALDSTLTPDEIERYTGIRINTDDDCTLYAICMECTSTLKKSIEYRTNCINNQIHFEELLMMLVTSAECTDPEDTETVICLDSDDDGTDLSSIEDIFHEETIPKKKYFVQEVKILLEQVSRQEVTMLQKDGSCTDSCNEGNEMYSANYIAIGEPYSSEISEDDVPDPSEKAKRKRNAKELPDLSKFTPDNYVLRTCNGVKKMYLKSLCDVCGVRSHNIKKHMQIHFPDTFYSCPHCSVVMKDKTNMKAHIDTVHFKKVGKTCNICGKGFIHHKTYRYHMLGHQSDGKAFECKVCGKTFNKPYGLSDHSKRVHNLTKPPKRALKHSIE